MSDIVSRLRAHAPYVEGWEDGETGEPIPFASDLREAANEIERLRRIVYSPLSSHDGRCDCAQCIPF